MFDCGEIKDKKLTANDIILLKAATEEGFRRKKINAAAIDSLQKEVEGMDDKQFKRWLKGLIAQDSTVLSTSVALEHRADAISVGAQLELKELIMKSKAKMAGINKQTDVHEGIIRALFHESSDFTPMAKAWRTVMDGLGDRLERVGGRRPSYLPKMWNPNSVRKFPLSTFKEDLLSRLDFPTMGLERRQVEPLIKDYYDNIITEGVHKIQGEGLTATARQSVLDGLDILEYRTADDWIFIQKKYGNPNIFAAMGEQIGNLSREIAMKERLGGNPDNTMAFIKETATLRFTDPNVADNVMMQYQQYAGYTSPVSGKLAQYGASIRNVEVMTKLGSAAISSLTDVWFGNKAARFNGMPAFKHALLFLKNATGSKEEMAKRGLDILAGANHLLDNTRTGARFADVSGEMAGHYWSDVVADAVIRGSGLNMLTAINKQTFAELFSITLAEGNFNLRTLDMFKRYGINEADLQALKKAGTIHGKYANLGGMDYVHREKFSAMMAAEIRMAVPEPGIRTKAALNQGTRTGTPAGELVRALGMFKSFPMQITSTMLPRYYVGRSAGNRVKDLGEMVVMLSLLGYLVIQAKEMIKGRKPRELNAETLRWSMQQGGSMGLIGDFMLEDYTRYGQSIANTLSGPILSDASGVVTNGYKTAMAIAFGSKKDFDKAISKAAIDTAKGINPLDNLWYTKLIVDRAVNDAILKATNSQWKNQWRKAERARIKRGGGKAFVKPIY